MVSIIVPVYNVAPYIQQCLDSIGMLGRNDIEIILVNDGSTDDSGAICKEYCEKWCNVRLIEKQNGGLSDARNFGTEAAQGEYIYYLDSDDWLVPGAIDSLYKFAVENSCDIVQGGFYYAYENYLVYDNRWFDADQKPFILSRDEAMRELVKDEYVNNFAWGKLYKAELVKQNSFIVNKFYEDIFWQHLNVWKIKNYGVMATPLYYYRQRNSSISGQGGVKYLDLIEGAEQRLMFISKNMPQLESLMADKLWDYTFSGLRNNNLPVLRKELSRISNQYKSVFSKRLRESLYFKFANIDSGIILQVFNMALRVYGRLKYKKLNHIVLNKE